MRLPDGHRLYTSPCGFRKKHPTLVLDFRIKQLYFSWEIKIVIWWKIVSSILMQNWKIWLQVIKDILFQIVVSGMKWDKKLKKWSSRIIQARFMINDFWLARKWSDSIGRCIWPIRANLKTNKSLPKNLYQKRIHDQGIVQHFVDHPPLFYFLDNVFVSYLVLLLRVTN